MRNHLYWAMEHCNADEATLRQHLEAAIDHFQMRHDRCNASSVCRQPGYVPEFIVVTDPVAVQLQYTGSHPTIFGRDTCLVESFNNVMLLYINKRVHYRNETYELRRNLAVLDWNEHVSRAYTSVWRGLEHMDGRLREARPRKEALQTKDLSVCGTNLASIAVCTFMKCQRGHAGQCR